MIKTIYFGAGCFWGVQFYFDQVDGVITTEVGFMGGRVDNPSYEDVCYKNTGHVETTKVVYDTIQVSDEKITKHFFGMHNPTHGNRQGIDVGEEYRSVIFYNDEEQRIEAEKVRQVKDVEYGGKVTTTIEPAPMFWPAEGYHQKFAERTGRGMCHVAPSSVKVD